jgi:hypothetical protein
MFTGEAGAYLRDEPLRFLALLANIRLGCKSFPGINALGYYKVTAVKSFITLSSDFKESSIAFHCTVK